MVNHYGIWCEEKDYSKYPKEKWCDYDEMAVWVRQQGYTPRTTMENLISIIFAYFDDEDTEEWGESYIDGCKEFVVACGGIREFDWWV